MKEADVEGIDLNRCSVHTAAQLYSQCGLSVIPVFKDGSKRPLVEWKRYQTQTATDEDLAKWFKVYEYGIGIICGAISGNLEVLDFERRFTRLKEYQELVRDDDPNLFKKLLIVRTASKGHHIYYRCKTIEGNQDLALKSNGEKYIETRGEGGYVIAVGSPVEVHPTNEPYELVRGSFDDIPVITPRERDILLDCARSFNEYVSPEKVFNPNSQLNGSRPGDAFNSHPNVRMWMEEILREMGCEIVGNRVIRPGGNRPSASLFSNGVLYNFSSNWNGLEAGKPYSPFGVLVSLKFEGSSSEAAKWLYKKGFGKKRSYVIGDNLAKVTLVEERIETVDDVFDTIVEHLPQRIDYKAEANLRNDEKLQMKEIVVITAKKIVETAKRLGLDFRFKGNLYVFNSQYWIEADISRDRIDALVPFLTSSIEKMGLWGLTQQYHTFVKSLCEQFITCVLSISFKQNKTTSVLINLKNGTLEISEDGRSLRDFDSKDFLTYQLPFDYDEKAKCPRWEKFLDDVLPATKDDADKSRQKVLAEYFGSCFTKLNLEKCLFLYGTGDNGKSVVFNVITALFGSQNVSYCSLENLAKHDSYLAQLQNKLLNFSSETSHYVDSEQLKKLASKEPIEVMRKYENPIQMTDYARLAFNANELPRAGKEYLHAFKRRFVIIPFDVRIEKEKIDPYLAERIIKEELSGIMNWLLRGLDRLLAQGKLSECGAADRAVDGYMMIGDTVAQWLEDEGWVMDEGLIRDRWIQLKDLYKNYLGWCVDFRQTKTLGRDQFKNRLLDMHNIKSIEIGHRQYYKLKQEVKKEKTTAYEDYSDFRN
jgi:putative DNA primase/helicase